jgi:hypothetical protein
MQTKRRKRPRVTRRSEAERNRKASFRDLKAFGIWRNRVDLKVPVQFTTELRARTERPIASR